MMDFMVEMMDFVLKLMDFDIILQDLWSRRRSRLAQAWAIPLLRG